MTILTLARWCYNVIYFLYDVQLLKRNHLQIFEDRQVTHKVMLHT